MLVGGSLSRTPKTKAIFKTLWALQAFRRIPDRQGSKQQPSNRLYSLGIPTPTAPYVIPHHLVPPHHHTTTTPPPHHHHTTTTPPPGQCRTVVGTSEDVGSVGVAPFRDHSPICDGSVPRRPARWRHVCILQT